MQKYHFSKYKIHLKGIYESEIQVAFNTLVQGYCRNCTKFGCDDF